MHVNESNSYIAVIIPNTRITFNLIPINMMMMMLIVNTSIFEYVQRLLLCRGSM